MESDLYNVNDQFVFLVQRGSYAAESTEKPGTKSNKGILNKLEGWKDSGSSISRSGTAVNYIDVQY